MVVRWADIASMRATPVDLMTVAVDVVVGAIDAGVVEEPSSRWELWGRLDGDEEASWVTDLVSSAPSRGALSPARESLGLGMSAREGWLDCWGLSQSTFGGGRRGEE